MIIEICCGDAGSVAAAVKGGARRIELCSGLTEGGLTPSLGLVRAAAASGIEEVNVLIRPRPGDFLYNREEMEIMLNDIRESLLAGATGIVIGALTPNGAIETVQCSRMVMLAREMGHRLGRKINVTFHRAFDLARDWRRSLEEIFSLGCDCLLTSGQSATAEIGIPILKEIEEAADGRILIMAGSGVTPGNVEKIVRETGVGAIHSTAKILIESEMIYRRPGVPMGLPGIDEYERPQTSAETVTDLITKAQLIKP